MRGRDAPGKPGGYTGIISDRNRAAVRGAPGKPGGYTGAMSRPLKGSARLKREVAAVRDAPLTRSSNRTRTFYLTGLCTMI